MVFFYIGEDLEGSKPCDPFLIKLWCWLGEVDSDSVKCKMKLDFDLTCVNLENKKNK
jgi:hypothetical protein